MSAYTGRGVGSVILGGVIDLHGCDVDISGGAEGRIGGGHLPLSIGRFQGEGAPALRSILGAGKGGQELPLPFDGSSAIFEMATAPPERSVTPHQNSLSFYQPPLSTKFTFYQPHSSRMQKSASINKSPPLRRGSRITDRGGGTLPRGRHFWPRVAPFFVQGAPFFAQGVSKGIRWAPNPIAGRHFSHPGGRGGGSENFIASQT